MATPNTTTDAAAASSTASALTDWNNISWDILDRDDYFVQTPSNAAAPPTAPHTAPPTAKVVVEGASSKYDDDDNNNNNSDPADRKRLRLLLHRPPQELADDPTLRKVARFRYVSAARVVDADYAVVERPLAVTPVHHNVASLGSLAAQMTVFDEWFWLAFIGSRGVIEYALIQSGKGAVPAARFLATQKAAILEQQRLRCKFGDVEQNAQFDALAVAFQQQPYNMRIVRTHIRDWCKSCVRVLQWFADYFGSPFALVHRGKGWCVEYKPRSTSSSSSSSATEQQQQQKSAQWRRAGMRLSPNGPHGPPHGGGASSSSAASPPLPTPLTFKTGAEAMKLHEWRPAANTVIMYMYDYGDATPHFGVELAPERMHEHPWAKDVVLVHSLQRPLAAMIVYSKLQLELLCDRLGHCRELMAPPNPPPNKNKIVKKEEEEEGGKWRAAAAAATTTTNVTTTKKLEIYKDLTTAMSFQF